MTSGWYEGIKNTTPKSSTVDTPTILPEVKLFLEFPVRIVTQSVCVCDLGDILHLFARMKDM